MAKRVQTIMLAALAMILLFMLTAFSYTTSDTPVDKDERHEKNCTKNIRLKASTKRELDQILHNIYMDYYRLIETYAWAGALTQPQKELRIKYLKNYIATFKKNNYQWCSEHESDEWEEEWFSNDG